MKNERVELRASQQERKMYEKAAASLGMNLSSFVRLATREKATEILRSDSNLILSESDTKIFLQALENPPKPNLRLKKAISSYHRINKK